MLILGQLIETLHVARSFNLYSGNYGVIDR